MSRIDEALNRVRGLTEIPGQPRSRGHADAASLDRYPLEGRPPGRVATEAPGHSRTVLAPLSPARSASDRVSQALDGLVVGSPGFAAVAIEQYRRLAAAMLEAQTERSLGSLMITSAVPREGKTLTATNLALTLSESYGRRVLLIDADLRRPAVHENFQLPNSTGLSDGLRAVRAQLPIHQVTPTLTVLPAGQPDANPMAGLSSERMKNLIAEAKARFDWVLVDSPPLGVLPDAQVVSRFMDAVLLVIGGGTTHYSIIQRAIAEVGADRLIGTVLNRVEDDAMPALDEYEQYYAAHSTD